MQPWMSSIVSMNLEEHIRAGHCTSPYISGSVQVWSRAKRRTPFHVASQEGIVNVMQCLLTEPV
jgi:hypothetical protein